jgi:hypothetical protein
VFSFPEVSGLHIGSLTHNVNCDRDLIFGYRQDTIQAVHAGQKSLFDVNCLACNMDIWAKMLSFLLFQALLPLVFPVVFTFSLHSNQSFFKGFFSFEII